MDATLFFGIVGTIFALALFITLIFFIAFLRTDRKKQLRLQKRQHSAELGPDYDKRTAFR